MLTDVWGRGGGRRGGGVIRGGTPSPGAPPADRKHLQRRPRLTWRLALAAATGVRESRRIRPDQELKQNLESDLRDRVGAAGTQADQVTADMPAGRVGGGSAGVELPFHGSVPGFSPLTEGKQTH